MAGPCSIFFVLDALLSVTLRVSSGLLCTLQLETALPPEVWQQRYYSKQGPSFTEALGLGYF